ncbi:hypothetical protein FF1_014355 [Malus domestica]
MFLKHQIAGIANTKKQQSFIQESLVDLAGSRGIDLVRINTEHSLADQGAFEPDEKDEWAGSRTGSALSSHRSGHGPDQRRPPGESSGRLRGPV